MLARGLISVGEEDVRNRERIISCSKGQVVDCRVFGVGKHRPVGVPCAVLGTWFVYFSKGRLMAQWA